MSDSQFNLNSLMSVSETVVGLVLIGKQTPTIFSPDKLQGKYGAILKDIQLGKTEEELYLKYPNMIQPAKYAAKSVNGMGEELDWVSVVDKAYADAITLETLAKIEKAIANGSTDKVDDLIRRMQANRNSASRMRSVSADEISDDYVPFLPSGTKSWDTHIGGFPNYGVVILAAPWGVGKTTSSVILMDNFLREYPEKQVLFVTLEDMNEGWKERANVILGTRQKDFWNRIKVMEFASNAEEIIQEASRYPDVGMVLVDYIDYMVKEESLSGYKEVYRDLSVGSKSLAVASKWKSMPIILLAQFGRGAYKGGVPTPHALMYTGEQFAYQLVMLYDPNVDFQSDNAQNPYTLPTQPGFGYIVSWKTKNGNRKHPEAPKGAIKVPMLSRGGFNLDAEGEWFSLMGDVKRETPPEKGRR